MPNTHYEEEEGSSPIDSNKIPKYSQEQVQHLQKVFGPVLRVRHAKDLEDIEYLKNQYILWNGQQMVLDYLNDLLRIQQEQ